MTVVGRTAVEAEILAKSLYLAGADRRRTRRTSRGLRPSSPAPTAVSSSQVVSPESGPHLLDTRPRQRTHGVRLAHELDSGGPRSQVAAVPVAQAGGGHRHSSLPGVARPRRGSSAWRSPDARFHGPPAARRAPRARALPVPATRHGSRRARSRAHARRVRLLLVAPTDRSAELASPALGDLRHLRCRYGSRHRGGTDTSQRWTFSLYLSAIGLVVAATAWRALMPPGAVSSPIKASSSVRP